MPKNQKEWMPIFEQPLDAEELFNKAVAGGAKTVEETQEEQRQAELKEKKEEEATIYFSFKMPKSINKEIESDLGERYRRISKNRWVMDAILEKLGKKKKIKRMVIKI
jgi:hypothetical protein